MIKLTGPRSRKTCRSLPPGPVDCRTGFGNLGHSFWQPAVKKWIRHYVFQEKKLGPHEMWVNFSRNPCLFHLEQVIFIYVL